MAEKSIKKNYIYYIMRDVSKLFFPLITFSYVSRVLSVDAVGKVDFCRSIVSYFTFFATLGISSYGIREGAKVRDDEKKLSKLAQELICINGIMTILTYIAFFFAVIYIPKFAAYSRLFLILSVTIGFTSLGLEWLYGALEEYSYISVRTIIFQVISLVLLLVFVREKTDYNKYAAILVFSTVGSNALNFIHAFKYIDFKIKERLNLKQHLKPILIFFSNVIAGNIYVTLDTSMVGILSSDYAVGLYSAANKMNRICISVVIALSTILLPRLSYYISNGKMERYKQLLKQCFDCILMLSFPVVIGIFVLSQEILMIFSGGEFLPAANCSRIISLIILFISFSSVLTNQIIIPFGKEKFQLYATLAGTLSNVVANMILIPKLAEVGAAIGTVMAEFTVCVFLFFYARRCFDYRFVFKKAWHYPVASILMIIFVLPIKLLKGAFLTCLLMGGCGAVIYFSILWIMKDDFFLYLLEIAKRYLKQVEKNEKVK